MNDQPIRILLVEDDPGDARLLREMLADAGTMRSELVWSTQLGEALQRLSAESFDVILLDLSLQEFPEALVNTIASRIEDLKHRAV
jgi:CheY-like chemotaxis protein